MNSRLVGAGLAALALLLVSACGTDPQGGATFSVCAASGTCSGSLSGTCTAAAADGASCSTTDTGAHCLAPATCVSGKCKLPDGVCK